MTLTQLRKVTKPTVRTGQARYVGTINSKGDQGTITAMTAPLSRVVQYIVLPRLAEGKPVEVRWSLLRRRWLRHPHRLADLWSPWVTVTK